MQINPFIINVPIGVVAMPKKDYIKASSEISDDATALEKLEQTHYLYDQQRKVSIYLYNHELVDQMLYGTLNPKGRDMFLYIMYHIPENQDWIKLKLSDIRKQTGISGNSVITGLTALKAAGIITLKSQSVYWVNPMFIFRGNRINYFRSISPDTIVVKNVIGRNEKEV